jgi:hypothetical protein
MSDKRKHVKQLCEHCKKSYVNLRRHRESAYHQRRAGQQAMPFAQESAQRP